MWHDKLRKTTDPNFLSMTGKTGFGIATAMGMIRFHRGDKEFT
jgi:hypothetical protein